MGTNSLINVADPTNAQDVSTKNYVDTAVSSLLPSTATLDSIADDNATAADVDMNNNKLIGLAPATLTTDAINLG